MSDTSESKKRVGKASFRRFSGPKSRKLNAVCAFFRFAHKGIPEKASLFVLIARKSTLFLRNHALIEAFSGILVLTYYTGWCSTAGGENYYPAKGVALVWTLQSRAMSIRRLNTPYNFPGARREPIHGGSSFASMRKTSPEKCTLRLPPSSLFASRHDSTMFV